MKEFIEELKIKLYKALLASRELSNPLERLKQALKIVQDSLVKLKQIQIEKGFIDISEEIHFFKTIKPCIYAYKIEEVMYFNLSINKPVGTKETQIVYFEEELKTLQRFFQLHAFHYQYYKLGGVELDSLYFVRGAQMSTIPILEASEMDPEFSTGMDFLFAKFIAYERLQLFIIEQIGALKNPAEHHLAKIVQGLKWTGDAINLVEIAYGMYHTGQLNHGNASLTQIVRWLEENLQVNIGRAHRRFTEISRRKRLSSTKYLDQMRDAINKKIENDLTIKHEKR